MPSGVPVLVSVIILAYRQPAFLNEALESVSRQTYAPIDIVVVDDGSGEEFVRQYRLPTNARLLVNEKNIGIAAVSRNRGIAARGEYIAFLDQDDVWEPEKIAVQVATMEAQPEAVMHYTQYLRVNAEGAKLERQNPFAPARGEMLKKIIRRKAGHMVCCSSVMLRKRALEKIGLFDENIRMSADWDMWIRCAATGEGAVIGDSRPLTKYREHGGQWSKKAVAGSLAALKVLEKTAVWAKNNRPGILPLIRRQRGRLLRDAARAVIADGNPDGEALTFLKESAKISPLALSNYALMWKSYCARTAHKE